MATSNADSQKSLHNLLFRSPKTVSRLLAIFQSKKVETSPSESVYVSTETTEAFHCLTEHCKIMF